MKKSHHQHTNENNHSRFNYDSNEQMSRKEYQHFDPLISHPSLQSRRNSKQILKPLPTKPMNYTLELGSGKQMNSTPSFSEIPIKQVHNSVNGTPKRPPINYQNYGNSK